MIVLLRDKFFDKTCRQISGQDNPEKYTGDALNEAFAVELFDVIETNGPDYWIYGHHHCNIPDFEIGNTTISTNQLGYVRYNEHIGFNDEKIIEI